VSLVTSVFGKFQIVGYFTESEWAQGKNAIRWVLRLIEFHETLL
jgi:hypothetical protein